MKNLFIMIFLFCFSLPLSGQKYTKVLDQEITAADLDYMPVTELRLLKNELIATKGNNVIKAKTDAEIPVSENAKPFLDANSEANLKLIIELEYNRSETDSLCTDIELLNRFIELITQKQKIPFYLQTRFLGRCQNPKANIYIIPAYDQFYTIGISEEPMVGPEVHKIFTISKEGLNIDSKIMNGKARFENNQIIHESYNSLIEYIYTIDEHGKFDKATPDKTLPKPKN